MSKSLKKLIDINRLREFKNKLVGTDSPYVQTGAVDQTIAGTKTFSKPIAGSVTGSSGSCTGNAATATTATTAKSCTGNSATATKLQTARSLWGNNFDGSAAITGPITGAPTIELMPASASKTSFIDFHFKQSTADYTSRIIESASGTLSINNVTITTGKVVTAKTFNGALEGNVTGNCSGSSGSCTGNAATATKLATTRTIALSGAATGTATAFDGSGNITIPVTSLDASKLTGTASVSTTGNAATATTATTAKSCTGNSATATKLQTARSLWGNNFDGSAAITGPITGMPAIEFMPAATANMGGYLDFHYNRSEANYTSRIIESASGTLSINSVTITTGRVVTAKTFNGALEGNVTGNCSGSSGSCTGNAATATKLATKRTIALSGAATGTATGFDGSGNITIPVTALASSAIRAQWYAAYPDGAEAHNAMWGGRDITAAFDAGTVSANIADGTFKDIFPGDYITKQVTISGTAYTVNWVVADCDYWWHKGDQDPGMETHHVVIVPQEPIFSARMNATNTTEGGYAGSEMYRNVIPACATGIVSAFGSSHILTFRDLITHIVDNNVASRGYCGFAGASAPWEEWVSVQCNLMTEHMVTGAPHYSSSGIDDEITTRQMSAFRLSERLINYNRQHWWLRNIVSSGVFAFVFSDGYACAYHASDVLGVRPFALLV